MGSGASKGTARGTQTGFSPNSHPPAPSPVFIPARPGDKQVTVRKERPPSSARTMPILIWPLPEDIPRDAFDLTSFDSNRYSLPPTSASTISIGEPEIVAAANTIPYKQQETSNQEWVIVDSQIYESAHVQSQLTARSSACFNLATSTDIDAQMKKFQQIYKKADERVKRRLDKVTADADKILLRIIEDTNKEQDRLLIYDKEQQALHERQYQEWLQKYIIELNKWRSQKLAELQEDLLTYQQHIADSSRLYIENLSRETNDFKMKILKEEQNNANIKTKDLTDKIHNIAKTGNLQQLGSESKTEFNLRIQANVGAKLPPN